jgi:hypothetical protein
VWGLHGKGHVVNFDKRLMAQARARRVHGIKYSTRRWPSKGPA